LKIASFILLAAATLVGTSSFGVVIDPDLKKILRRNAENEITTLITMSDPYDLSQIEKLKPEPAKRAAVVAQVLEAQLAKTSAKLLALISNGTITGVKEVTPLWIVNSLRVRGTSAAIQKILSLNGIQRIGLDSPKETDLSDEGNGSLAPAVITTGWGVAQVGAPQIWEMGIRGQGVTVAVIDSGANTTHPDLVKNLWRNPGETGVDAQGKDKATNAIDDDLNGYVDDVVGWNFELRNGTPNDETGHGTQSAGVVAGTGAGGTRTGVAPGATLMILRSCCGTGTQMFESNSWEAMQYAIKNGARVISMSLTVKANAKPIFEKWRRADEVLLAAGITHINSSGNLGPGNEPQNIGAPASNPPPWQHPDQVPLTGFSAMITVGATDEHDAVRDYSSTGPVTWESVDGYKDFPFTTGDKRGLVKPDVCAPSEVPSLAMSGEGYTVHFLGTSSSTPHIAGVVALLLSAKPNLNPAQILETLEKSAVPVGSSFNNQCGAGRVDAPAAVAYARGTF
jgi:subtilisin family serine protease